MSAICPGAVKAKFGGGSESLLAEVHRRVRPASRRLRMCKSHKDTSDHHISPSLCFRDFELGHPSKRMPRVHSPLTIARRFAPNPARLPLPVRIVDRAYTSRPATDVGTTLLFARCAKLPQASKAFDYLEAPPPPLKSSGLFQGPFLLMAAQYSTKLLGQLDLNTAFHPCWRDRIGRALLRRILARPCLLRPLPSQSAAA